jgi:hypothetical protein
LIAMSFLKRRLPLAAALACAAGACAWAAGAPGAGASVSGDAPSTQAPTVTLDRCHAAPLQADRYATFSAQMAANTRTRQMWVRFTLLERLAPGVALRPAQAPGLGVWQKSQPGVALFRYSQEVANLPAPGGFRASVSFRWYDAHHHLIRRARALSPLCELPDERPHLAVGAITSTPGAQPQTTAYAVSVSNEGLGPASNVGVLLSIDGATQPQQTISQLAPGSQQTVTFSGPRCNAPGSLTVTLDPSGSIDQTTRADDVKTVACP